MVRMEQGMLARSIAGHDRGRLYVIIRVETEYVWLVDGILRTVDKPKKKRIRHIQVIHRYAEPVRKALKEKEPLQNEPIKQIIQSESRKRREDKHVESRCN
ncbi:MAG: KOW domain-containing RNA-binding protein [Lachnospiraceae bacterium]|nr:KOW domain-containing RNA-binding protein [Lachnospiraceae bacterium]